MTPAFVLLHRFFSLFFFFDDAVDTQSHKSIDFVLPFFVVLWNMKGGSTQFATTTGDAEANNEEEALDEVIELEFLVVEEHIFFSKMATRNINARTETVLFAVVWIIIIIDIVLVVKLENTMVIVPNERTFLAIDNT